MRIVYFGTPDFAARVLERLLEGGIELVAVVTQPPRPKGRSGSPVPGAVAELVRKKLPDLPLFEWENASAAENLATLAELEADLFVVVAFGQFLAKGLRDLPRLDCINLHPSLLPKYRGAAPIQHSLINGDLETGVSVMKVVKEMDAGDVILQERTPIAPAETLGHLESRLCKMGADLLLQAIEQFGSGDVTYTRQDEAGVTHASKLMREDGELHWQRPARELFCRYRGVTPRPGAWSRVWIRGKESRMKILECTLLEGERGEAGEQLEPLVVACGEGALRLERVQLEGRRGVDRDELLRGLTPEEINFQG